jgi:hypothetical protein
MGKDRGPDGVEPRQLRGPMTCRAGAHRLHHAGPAYVRRSPRASLSPVGGTSYEERCVLRFDFG